MFNFFKNSRIKFKDMRYHTCILNKESNRIFYMKNIELNEFILEINSQIVLFLWFLILYLDIKDFTNYLLISGPPYLHNYYSPVKWFRRTFVVVPFDFNFDEGSTNFVAERCRTIYNELFYIYILYQRTN